MGFLVVCASAAAFATSGIVVNEVSNGGGGAGSTHMAASDYIEFTLTQTISSAGLSALTFGEANGSTSAMGGVFQFDKTTLDTALASSGQTSFLAGTVIVVKGTSLGAQDLSYHPLATNATDDAAWSIQLVAGQGALWDSDFNKNNNFTLTKDGGAAWISASNPPTSTTDTSGFISGIAYDSNGSMGTVGNAIQASFGSSNVLVGTLPTGSSLSNIGSDAATALTTNIGGTLGTPNGGANTIWIDGLRYAAFGTPEPSRALLMLLGASICFFKRQRPQHPQCPNAQPT